MLNLLFFLLNEAETKVTDFRHLGAQPQPPVLLKVEGTADTARETDH